MKAPTTFTIEDVLERLTTSMEDHDVGWARIEKEPLITKCRNETIRATVRFQPTGWNTTDKSFRIIIEEA
jgi:hypothetical protein